MEKTVFLETVEGMLAEQVIRDHEYSMYSRHFHESYELYILLEGERYYFIDKETYLVKAGMAVLVSRNQIHKTSMAGDSYHDRMLLQMDGKAFQPFMQLTGTETMESLFEQLKGVVEYTEEDWAAVVWLLSQIKHEMKQRKVGYEPIVKMMVIHLLTLTARNRSAQRTTLPRLFSQENYQAQTPRHLTIRQVTTYLLNNYQKRESLEALAARFYVSKSYLCRIFKEVTGFTIIEYQNLARIKAAQKLLAETALPVTEVAARVGFESITYFERVFKKHTDQRPLQYRQKKLKL
ncbi:MAG: AraC family transcriptional regulator [Lachnospiraceae bacterium]